MFLIYFDTDTEKSYMYCTTLDKYRMLGEINRFCEVLTGLYIYDHITNNIVGHYDSSIFMWGLKFRK